MPNPIQITTNYKRAEEVARKAVSMLEQKVYPFNIPDLFPDAIVPDGIKPGSEEHALFLFFACSLDRGRDSKTLYRKCREMAGKLDFSELHKFDESYIKWFLERNFEKPKNSEKTFGDPVGTWVYNSEKLAQEYKNDPRNLKVDALKETLKNIRGFKGFGKETPWLLIKNYTKAGIWQFPLEQLNIKIDRHVIRISYGTGVIVLPQDVEEIRYDALVPPLSKVYGRVISEKIVSPIQLNDAFWAIGQYRCGENNAVYCDTDCPMKCKIKPKTDKQFTTLNLSQDARANTRNLFSKRD